MKNVLSLLLLTLLTGALLAQDAPEPYPGQREHKEPPSGWYCQPAQHAQDLAANPHACECRGMRDQDPYPYCWAPGEDENGNQVEQPVGENARCKAWCHKSHCLCAHRCGES